MSLSFLFYHLVWLLFDTQLSYNDGPKNGYFGTIIEYRILLEFHRQMSLLLAKIVAFPAVTTHTKCLGSGGQGEEFAFFDDILYFPFHPQGSSASKLSKDAAKSTTAKIIE